MNATEVTVAGENKEQLFPDGEFKCEIVDDKFKIEGIHYTLKKQSGNYVKVEYARVDDGKMQKIDISSSGHGRYIPWNLDFQFVKTGNSINWNLISVVKKIQCVLVDRAVKEWCAFDGSNASSPTNYAITPSKTFVWYIGNQILNILRDYGDRNVAMNKLGNGVLYSGALNQGTYTITTEHEVVGGEISTKCTLVKHINGSDDTRR